MGIAFTLIGFKNHQKPTWNVPENSTDCIHNIFTSMLSDSCLCAKYVLAVCLENGTVLLMKHYYDVSPIQIQTGLCPVSIEWSNSKQLLAAAGTVPQTEYCNMVKVYTDTGSLLYQAVIPYTLVSSTFSGGFLPLWSDLLSFSGP